MENVIYNELRMRGLNVDVGVVEYNYKNEDKKQSERTWKLILLLIEEVIDTIFNQHLMWIQKKNKCRKRNL